MSSDKSGLVRLVLSTLAPHRQSHLELFKTARNPFTVHFFHHHHIVSESLRLYENEVPIQLRNECLRNHVLVNCEKFRQTEWENTTYWPIYSNIQLLLLKCLFLSLFHFTCNNTHVRPWELSTNYRRGYISTKSITFP